ncbi:hypothetical protein [Streptomyces sp. H27-S2]|uniref:hypothetical protein n=1 Tax=Streptomyces antarcticus TaxID=2996458 RepID=UPI00226FF3E2|nr:hypothetical protein [Streptomyces sp. H27-S2]MCY0954073.1 hypothetical protein [Streptomyces sp. H27-S2]
MERVLRQRVAYTRNRRGGATPAPRPEQWWKCPGYGRLGYRRAEGVPLRPVRSLPGDGGDCFFCGDEECDVAGKP